MDLENDILDLPEREEGWSKDPRWLVGFLLSTLLVPVLGGVVLYRFQELEEMLIVGYVLLLLLVGVALSGRFLAMSRSRLPGAVLALIAIPQAYLMIVFLINSADYFEDLAIGQLDNWTFRIPDFNSRMHFFAIATLCSIYVSWLALSIRLHRRADWVPYLIFALFYSVVAVWALFVAEVFGPV
ncbi:MAG: hypothetical protein AAF433_19580 [Bacteroidota bacterium]